MSKSYSELLRDPKWQRKRLEILSRSDFTCENCGDSESTLNVHHKVYHKGAMPWEYDQDELTALCEKCHEKWHKVKSLIDSLACFLTIEDLTALLGVGVAIAFQKAQVTQLNLTEPNPPLVNGFCEWLDLDPEKANRLADAQGWIDVRNIPALRWDEPETGH